MKYKVSKLKTTKARMNFVYSIRHLRRLMTREIDDDDYNGKRKYIYKKKHTYIRNKAYNNNKLCRHKNRTHEYVFVYQNWQTEFIQYWNATADSLCSCYFSLSLVFFCMHFEWVERSPTTHTLSLTCFHLRLTHKFLVPNNVYTCVVDEYVAAML